MQKYFFSIPSALVLSFLVAASASAHVIVAPSEATVGQFQNFSVGVPTEKDTPTVGVRLVIPTGLAEVTPNVKPGWKVTTKEDAKGNVTEIEWTAGSIPPEQRDQFLFSAQVPATPTTLIWKAYQTYKDGTVVSWDHNPSETVGDDDDASPPYSETTILPEHSTAASTQNSSDSTSYALIIAVVALFLAGYAALRVTLTERSR